MGALRASDGAFLMGVMSASTANAGRIYFAAGTPDRNDLRGDTVDLLGNVLREIAEETGLAAADLAIAPGWHAVVDGPRVAVMKPVAVPFQAAEARADAAPPRQREGAGTQRHPHRPLRRGPRSGDAAVHHGVSDAHVGRKHANGLAKRQKLVKLRCTCSIDGGDV
jgi:hypothetical protein